MSVRSVGPLPLFLGASLTALALGAAAHAETAPADAVDEVIVVADKRAVNLQKAPAAITAISGEQLDRANITDALTLNGRVPGLSVTQSESFQRLVSIRGVGFSTPQNGIAQPGVALHIDGVYVVGGTALTQDFFDVERLDVLRGPQGTVYGQNAEGGTINVITKAPDLSARSGAIDVAAGNYNLFSARAAVNLPLSDSLALRVAAT